MTDCKVYSSLFALVDSHLSNISSEESQSDGNDKNSMPIPPVIGSASEVYLSTFDKKLPIPQLSASESPIAKVLANQVNNMLLAKARRQQEELKQKQAKENMEMGEEDDFVIDLMQALQTSNNMNTPLAPKSISSSSSCESLFDIQFMDCDEEVKQKTSEPLLPCILDMSYILNKKVPKSRCSTFGKVLVSRERPVAGICWHEKFDTNVKVFKFDTPSPCDVIKSKLRKPTISCSVTIEDYLII